MPVGRQRFQGDDSGAEKCTPRTGAGVR